MDQSVRRGLSLLEVVVVLGIIAVVIALLLPATRRVHFAAERMQCGNNLKQVVFGLHSYAENQAAPPTGGSDGPAARLFPTGYLGPETATEDRLSWMVTLLPYLEQDSLYRQFDSGKGYTGNLPAAGTRIKTFICPNSQEVATGDAVTHYVAMAGLGHDAAGRPAVAAGNGFMGYDRTTSFAAIKDGTSTTIALMETRFDLGSWARGGASNLRGFDPADSPWCGDQRPFGGHSGGMQAAMADGSVRFLRLGIDPKQLAAAITIAGGETVNLD